MGAPSSTLESTRPEKLINWNPEYLAARQSGSRGIEHGPTGNCACKSCVR